MNRRVVVTGIGIITAHGVGKQINWTSLEEGKSSIRKIKSSDSSRYTNQHKESYAGEAREFVSTTIHNLKKTRLDRASHLLIHATREALFDANIIDYIKKIPTFLVLGTTLGGMLSGERFHKEVIEKGISRAKISILSDYLAHYQAINLFKEFELYGDFLIFSNEGTLALQPRGEAPNI